MPVLRVWEIQKFCESPRTPDVSSSARIGGRCLHISLASRLDVQSAGVILLREAIPVSTAIEELALIWNASEAEEWVNRIVWIPL